MPVGIQKGKLPDIKLNYDRITVERMPGIDLLVKFHAQGKEIYRQVFSVEPGGVLSFEDLNAVMTLAVVPN